MSIDLAQSVITELVISPMDAALEREGEKWRVKDLSSAEYAMAKMKFASDKIAEAETFAKDQKKRIDDWLKDYIKDSQQTIEFFTGAMRQYALEQLSGQKKSKTVKLPGGTGSFRKEQPKYQRDEAKLLAWLKEYRPEWVRTKTTEEVAWDALKDAAYVIDGRMIIWEELDHPAIEDCIENNGMLLDKEGLAIVGNIVQGVQVDEDVPDKFTIKLV